MTFKDLKIGDPVYTAFAYKDESKRSRSYKLRKVDGVTPKTIVVGNHWFSKVTGFELEEGSTYHLELQTPELDEFVMQRKIIAACNKMMLNIIKENPSYEQALEIMEFLKKYE